jgi:outer membrane murein-binding lipoprotein Lpp
MYKTVFRMMIAAVFCGIMLTGCGGGNDPKSLAKQGLKCMVELKKATDEGANFGDAKYDAIVKKWEPLNAKVKALSEEDAKIYMEELTKLIQEAGLN